MLTKPARKPIASHWVNGSPRNAGVTVVEFQGVLPFERGTSLGLEAIALVK